ncbi:unnamed protein product [Trichogramma brassicae]|uniref:Uncharacterized protein n=1 Tax=Trichogramma brassicae TaxID=86971 RepID=A0A6H5IBF0_9HYME|nr:unnamed protein product [Trichogramma brassicae]
MPCTVYGWHYYLGPNRFHRSVRYLRYICASSQLTYSESLKRKFTPNPIAPDAQEENLDNINNNKTATKRQQLQHQSKLPPRQTEYTVQGSGTPAISNDTRPTTPQDYQTAPGGNGECVALHLESTTGTKSWKFPLSCVLARKSAAAASNEEKVTTTTTTVCCNCAQPCAAASISKCRDRRSRLGLRIGVPSLRRRPCRPRESTRNRVRRLIHNSPVALTIHASARCESADTIDVEVIAIQRSLRLTLACRIKLSEAVDYPRLPEERVDTIER